MTAKKSPKVVPESWRPVLDASGVKDEYLDDPIALEYGDNDRSRVKL
jgi:hypothetical protein